MKAMIIVVLLLCCGCGTPHMMKTVSARNNLQYLETGMTKDQVKNLMGTPYKTEAYVNIEYWLYQTEGEDLFVGGHGYKSDRDFTPVAFENGQVIGWGRNFYQKQKERIEADISIKQN
jgi:outer membrane protein assembly factor BamE (lipoprotein component of BamABCDE complex)